MSAWRQVSNSPLLNTDRMPVPGGWLYATYLYPLGGTTPVHMSTTFVPDSGREWEAAYSTYQRVTQQEGR